MARINSEIKAAFVNDVQVPIVDGSFNSNLGGSERTSVMGSGRRLGSSEANQPGSCSFEVAYTKGFNLRGTLDVVEAKVRIVWNSGAEWLLTSADLSTPLEASAPEGRVSVSYEGDPWLVTKD
jgi:hypothetical protein